MKEWFQFVQGSVIGRDHRIPGKNNQDARYLQITPECVVAVVSDGCSEGSDSEVGARLGARLTAERLCFHAKQSGSEMIDLESARGEILEGLEQFIQLFEGSRSAIVNRYLLFTAIAAILTPTWSTFVSIGDGLIVVNGEEFGLGPFPNNTPPYVAYGLVETSLDPTLLRFQTVWSGPTDDVQSFLVGCDGLLDYRRVSGKPIPGKAELVGPISRLWEEDRFYANEDAARRHLSLVNRDVLNQGTVLPGLLPDDTTFIAGRRRK